jgi:hypothetical protein
MLAHLKINWQFHAHRVHQKESRLPLISYNYFITGYLPFISYDYFIRDYLPLISNDYFITGYLPLISYDYFIIGYLPLISYDYFICLSESFDWIQAAIKAMLPSLCL